MIKLTVNAALRYERLLMGIVILAFFAACVLHLDRLPHIFEDETWILSPGYKLFTHGQFGSDMFTGFYNMDQHYLQFMPIFPVLQGAFAQLIGLGIFQMRVLPVFIATLAVALAGLVARQMGRPGAGLLAMWLLFTWQWMPELSHRNMQSGVPLIDSARLARYDALAALFGLCAFACFIMARRRNWVRFDLLCGGFIGLAGLTHIYGFFWLPTLALAGLIDTRSRSRTLWRSWLTMLAGATLVALPWALVLLANPNDAIAQARTQSQRFSLSPLFFIDNALNEWRRYVYGLGTGAGLLRPGFYSLVPGLPVLLGYMVWRAVRNRHREARWLTVICLMLPTLFAVLLQPKTYHYLPTLVVCWVLPVAVGLSHASRWPKLLKRLAVACVAVVSAFGLYGIWQMHVRASRIPSPTIYLAELDRAVPKGVRVLSMPNHWLALQDRDFRVIYVPFYLAAPAIVSQPISLFEALDRIQPNIILIDAPVRQMLQERQNDGTMALWISDFKRYMAQHDARQIGSVDDNAGQPIEIYQLN